jgi:hypothetical protein
MPYVPLQIGDHVTAPLRDLVKGTIDQAFREIRLIMTFADPDQGPKGSLQISIAILLMAATDGAAQILIPGIMSNGTRFKKFVVDYFSFDGVETPKEEVADFLWDGTRNALLHRFGLHTSDAMKKFGRMFTISDDDLEKVERYPSRPYSVPFFVCVDERTVVWLEAYYWELRQAIIKALDTPDKVLAVEEWIRSGKWDHSQPAAAALAK